MSEQPKAPAPAGRSTAVAPVREERPRRWEPLQLLEEMQTDLARLVEGPLGLWPLGRQLRRMPVSAMAGMPRVDVFEREGTLLVKVELPGIKKEDVELNIEDGDLVLRAERREEHEVKDEQWYRMERSYGSLFRRLPLPEGVQADQIQAALTDGVLEVTIPKPAATAAEGKRIPIG